MSLLRPAGPSTRLLAEARRPALALAGAALAGALLGVRLAEHSALCGTVALTPMIAVALVLLARHLSARLPGWLGLLLCGLLALALAEPALDVPGLDRLLMVGLVGLLAAAVVRLLPALRRQLTAPAQLARPPLSFFWLPLLVYVALIPWTSSQRPPDGDEPYYLLIAHSLVHDLDVDLSNDYAEGSSLAFMPRRIEPQLGDPQDRQGHWFSRHDVLFPLAASLPYALGGLHGVLVLIAALAAALGWWTLRLSRHFAGPDGAFRAWALVAFLSPLLVYSHQVWIEVPAALLVVIALDHILVLDGRAPTRREALVIMAATLLLLPLKLRLGLLAGPLAALFWWRSGRRTRLAVLVSAPLLVISIALLAFNQWFFGRALKVYELGDLGLFEPPLRRYLDHLFGLGFDLSFGLLALAPVWLLAVPAVGWTLRRDASRAGAVLLALAPYFFLLLSRREWYGGWSPAFRYGLVALPMLAALMAPALGRARGPGWRVLFACGAAATGAALAAAIAVPGWTFNFADGSSRLVDLAGLRLGADVGRLLPSGIRPRLATWLVPLVLGLGAWSIARWRGPARARRLGARAGLGLALLIPGVLSLAALHIPTETVEVEDAWVAKSGGDPHPSQWTPDRARFRGAWTLPAGDSLRLTPVAGGSRLAVVVTLRPGFNTPAPLRLALLADGAEVAITTIDPSSGEDWRDVTLGPVEWPAGGTLEVACPRVGRRRHRNYVLIDRLELEWN